MDSSVINPLTMPWDKSWGLRCGVKDILAGEAKRTAEILDAQPYLADDLVALQKAAQNWDHARTISVGESGSLFRFLQYAIWQEDLDKELIKSGTLIGRPMSGREQVLGKSQAELLLLDKETSQWATAAVLNGDTERLTDPPYKLAVTYQAVEYWTDTQSKGESWQLRKDATITAQAVAFQSLLKGLRPDFEPMQAEDFPFARVFGYMTTDEAKKRWRSLAGHESNRFEEVDAMLALAEQGEPVPTRDHRIAQAITFWGKIMEREVDIVYPNCVSKSWPREQFNAFLESLS